MSLRQKNVSWEIIPDGDRYHGKKFSWYAAQTAVLMDIRDELQKLNAVFACPSFQAIPVKLDQIITNTTKRKYTKRVIK